MENDRMTGKGNPSSGVKVAVALACALGGTLGCTAYATKKSLPIDCSVMNAYDLDNAVDNDFGYIFGANDATRDASVGHSVDTIPDGPICGDKTALHITGVSFNDWGSLFSFYQFTKLDEATREGMSFWARAPGESNKGITVLLDDPNTKNWSANCMADGGVKVAIPPGDAGAYCTTYCTPDAGSGTTATAPVYDPASGAPLSSGNSTAQLPANACGNSYQIELSLTSDWKFYTIPFAEFQQQPNQDRVPNPSLEMVGPAPGTAMLTQALWELTVRMPKGAPYEFWFDRVGFYSKKTTDGGSDGQ
ncbi:MAG TPA: hypothetical protein VHO06_11240 [Polyangia bacterium]|nr:hypothetical protein [Polyangia bacterium]